MSDAVSQTQEGVRLQIEVVPGAPVDSFPDGYNPWRGRVKAKVKAPAQDGQANQALCQLVAAHLGLDPNDVTLEQGHTSRRKTLHLAGQRENAIRQALEGALGT